MAVAPGHPLGNWISSALSRLRVPPVQFGPQLRILTTRKLISQARYSLFVDRKLSISSSYSYCGDDNIEKAAEYNDINILKVPNDIIMLHQVALPASASKNLRSAVGFGLSAWTPFEASDVHFVCAAASATENAQVSVEIRIVPKQQLRTYIDSLDFKDFDPDALLLGDEPKWELPLPTEKRRKQIRSGIINYALVMTAMVGLLVSVVVATARQRDYAFRLREAQKSELVARQAETALRQNIERSRSTFDALSTQRSRHLPLTEQLSALAHALEGDARLVEVSISDSGITGRLIGTTAADISQSVGSSPATKIKVVAVRPISSMNSLIEFSMAR